MNAHDVLAEQVSHALEVDLVTPLVFLHPCRELLDLLEGAFLIIVFFFLLRRLSPSFDLWHYFPGLIVDLRL